MYMYMRKYRLFNFFCLQSRFSCTLSYFLTSAFYALKVNNIDDYQNKKSQNKAIYTTKNLFRYVNAKEFTAVFLPQEQ